MVAERAAQVARDRPNTLDLGVRGFVWVRFVSPFGHPIGGVECRLRGGGREWEPRFASRDGEACWEWVPLRAFDVELRLSDRRLVVPVPWLRSVDHVHVQRLMDAGELLGGADCPFGIQVRLNGLGYRCGVVDGVIGPNTGAATEEFQNDRRLLADGRPGPATQGYLVELFGA